MTGYVLTEPDDIFLAVSRLATAIYAMFGLCFFGMRAARRPKYQLVSRSILTFGAVMYAALFLLESQVLLSDGSLFDESWFRSLYKNAFAWSGAAGLLTMWFAEVTLRRTLCAAQESVERVQQIQVGQ